MLREVEPELMDRLIKATKDSDHKELQALTALVSDRPDDDNNLIETEYEEEEEEEEVWVHFIKICYWLDMSPLRVCLDERLIKVILNGSDFVKLIWL